MSDAGKVFKIQFQDKEAVYGAYMSFSKDAGLFVPHVTQQHMGAPVFLWVTLPGIKEDFLVSGKVSWIAYGRRKGVGVRLTGDEWSKKLKASIENILGGMIKSPNPTFTM